METAKERYAQMESNRTAVLQRARDCSALTIPSLIPPEGDNDSAFLPQPFQSLGARGVNNMGSKLLMALFPAGSSFFRLMMTDDLVDEADAEVRTEIENRLVRIESRCMRAFEASVLRPRIAESLLHLLVAGNVLVFYDSLTDFRVFRIDQYCMRRDAAGNPVECVVKECVHPNTLPEEVREACDVKKTSVPKEVDVYTLIEWKDGRCTYHQEINGKLVPGTEGDVPSDDAPWFPLRWKSVPGRDYGRGHVEEVFGDLRSLEGLSQSIVEFSAAAAKIVWLVAPNASTDPEDINNAESGEAVSGHREDISALQLEKYADFQVAQATAQRLEERLSYAFLLRSGVTRDAERVTAEEVRQTAQELDDAHGGAYTVLAQEYQLPLARRHLRVMSKSRKIPALPKGTVDPVIVTGFQALGRNHELNRMRGFFQDLFGLLTPEYGMKVVRAEVVAQRLGMGWGVEDVAGLLKTTDEIQAEESAAAEQNMMSQALDKATGPVAGAMAKQAVANQ